jgi:hypothetical protein
MDSLVSSSISSLPLLLTGRSTTLFGGNGDLSRNSQQKQMKPRYKLTKKVKKKKKYLDTFVRKAQSGRHEGGVKKKTKTLIQWHQMSFYGSLGYHWVSPPGKLDIWAESLVEIHARRKHLDVGF